MNTVNTQTPNTHSGQTGRVTGLGIKVVLLDICIILDATGSMAGCIDGVKRALYELLQMFIEAAMDAHFGLVIFRDERIGEFPELFPIGTPLDKLKSVLASTPATGGGDIPESSLLAIKHALSLDGYRAESKRILLTISDAPPHPDEKGVTSKVILDLLRREKAILFACTPNIEPYVTFANSTRGTLFEIKPYISSDAFLDIARKLGHETVKTVRMLDGSDIGSVMRDEMRKTMRLDH